MNTKADLSLTSAVLLQRCSAEEVTPALADEVHETRVIGTNSLVANGDSHSANKHLLPLQISGEYISGGCTLAFPMAGKVVRLIPPDTP